MSAEMVTMLIGVVSILLVLASGFGWMIHRMDSTANSLESRLGARIDKVNDELVEVKVAIARIEGPPRHLVTSR